MNNTTITQALPADLPGIYALICELALYERAPEEVTLTIAQLEADFHAGLYHAYVAKDEDKIVGMALFYPIYSTWKGLSYYLEDIVVTESHRCKGIGSLLFEEVIAFCAKRNAARLKWQVLDWNEPAINFYKRYNPYFDTEWLTCRMTAEQIQAALVAVS